MSPVYLSTAANARERQISPLQNNNKSAVTFSNSHSAFPILLCRGHMCGPQPEDNRASAGKPRAGHARPLRVNQQIKNPPLPPQQHQLKILHTNKYIQNDRQKDPGLPLGWA